MSQEVYPRMRSNEVLKVVYVTKYALTQGILVESVLQDSGSKYCYTAGGGSLSKQYIMGTNCFETRAEAVVRAKSDAKKKIASLKKQIQTLETMYFSK